MLILLISSFEACQAIQHAFCKLDIKRREPGILFISIPSFLLFKLANMTYFSILVLIQRRWQRHSKGATSS